MTTSKPDQSPAPISPRARRMAEEGGLDLTTLSGSGPGGRVLASDVEAALEAAGPAPAVEPTEGDEIVKLGRVQRLIAERMVESKSTVPDFALMAEVGMDRCVALREELRSTMERPPSINDFVVKACAGALREHRRVNAAYVDGNLELRSRVNVGIAVATEELLVVPTLFDVDQMSIEAVAMESRRLAGQVRAGKVSPAELADGTFTVSNLGMFGIRRFTAVINPPQAAILAVGAVVERIREVDGEVALAKVMDLNLSCDHRVVYGATGARFLATVTDLLEDPAALVSGPSGTT